MDVIVEIFILSSVTRYNAKLRGGMCTHANVHDCSCRPVVDGHRGAARSGAGVLHRQSVGHRCGSAATRGSAVADRADLLRVLGNPEVKAVAEKGRSRSSESDYRITRRPGADGRCQARQPDQALAGRTVQDRHLTTLIITALLVLILIIAVFDRHGGRYGRSRRGTVSDLRDYDRRAVSGPSLCSDRRRADIRAALTILDVPFISQSEALCGGAAAAMVMRYRGARARRGILRASG